MFCYSCAANIENNESYCRECGTEVTLLAIPDKSPSAAASAFHFFFGLVIFIIVFLAVSFVLSALFPTGGPQLAILTLMIMASLLAGVSSALYMKAKGLKRPTAKSIKSARRQGELDAPTSLQLPEERGFYPPASVTDSTTNKLNVR